MGSPTTLGLSLIQRFIKSKVLIRVINSKIGPTVYNLFSITINGATVPERKFFNQINKTDTMYVISLNTLIHDDKSAFGSRLFVGVEKPKLPYFFLSEINILIDKHKLTILDSQHVVYFWYGFDRN